MKISRNLPLIGGVLNDWSKRGNKPAQTQCVGFIFATEDAKFEEHRSWIRVMEFGYLVTISDANGLPKDLYLVKIWANIDSLKKKEAIEKLRACVIPKEAWDLVDGSLVYFKVLNHANQERSLQIYNDEG